MAIKTRKLLGTPDRRLEVVAGWVCALVSLSLAALLSFLLYVVGWRNPHRYGTHDLLKPATLAFFAGLLVIAIGFSVLASRLLASPHRGRRLLSPFALRAWGVFFLVATGAMLLDASINHRWTSLLHLWEMLTMFMSMAAACFALAERWKNDDKTR